MLLEGSSKGFVFGHLAVYFHLVVIIIGQGCINSGKGQIILCGNFVYRLPQLEMHNDNIGHSNAAAGQTRFSAAYPRSYLNMLDQYIFHDLKPPTGIIFAKIRLVNCQDKFGRKNDA